MVFGVVNQAIIGIHQTFGAAVAPGAVDVAFVVFTPVRFGKPALIVAKIVAADALAGRNGTEIALFAVPAERLCLPSW